MIAADLRYSIDPVSFALACGVTPDLYQAEVLRSDSKRQILKWARQSGKTEVVALKALHTALFNSGSVVLLASPSQRQSAELLLRIKNLHGKIDGAQQPDTESVLRIEFANGSRVIALPGTEKTTRGMTAHLVILDEASRVEDSLYTALRPTLSTTNGSLILLSTPAGKRGHFYEIWNNADPSWKRTSIVASQCPRISKQFLESEMRELGPLRYSEEYEPLAFVDDLTSTFSTAIIDAAFSSEVRPLWT